MRRLGADDGFALVPALAVVVIVLLLGAALLSTVNVQSNQSGAAREQEGSFQLADGALNSQVLQLARTWPTSAATAYPTCDQSSASTATCTGSALTANFTGASSSGAAPNGGSDFVAAPTWSTRVIDDVDGSSHFEDALATRSPAPCACDANGDGAVWVRSEANVAGRRSVLVSLVQQSEPRQEAVPSATIIAGWFETTNSGNKTIVDAHPSTSATTGPVLVRCASNGPSGNDPCLGYHPGQLNPDDAFQSSYVDGTGLPNATNRSILDADALARLKATAARAGTYYASGCPSSLTGALVYIENGDCYYGSNSQYNSVASPGVVIIGTGTLSFGGTSDYYGLVYAANGQGSAPSSGPCTSAFQNLVVSLGGNAVIHGAVMIDKCGGVSAGASKENILYDSNVFASLVSSGTAAAVKNSFRILPLS